MRAATQGLRRYHGKKLQDMLVASLRTGVQALETDCDQSRLRGLFGRWFGCSTCVVRAVTQRT